MKKKNQITPPDSNLSILNVNKFLILTDKSISDSTQTGVILCDSKFYHEQSAIEASIINFVSTHFYYFIIDIKKRYLENNIGSIIFESSMYVRLSQASQESIEFPYAEHRTRGGGGYGYGIVGWGEMSENERVLYRKRSSLLDDELRISILTQLTPRIIGNIFSKLADTSVGKVIGIRIQTAERNTIKSSSFRDVVTP